MHLYQETATRVHTWRENGYPHQQFPVIAEILEWARQPDGGGFRLRQPQLRALETYWYLRLVENTPHIFDLYQSIFNPDEDPDAFLHALGIPLEAFGKSKYSFNRLFQSIRSDDAFVKEYRLESQRETLSLAYPSYIFALAMGAGKTRLIGAIIAAEFAMALEYPHGNFVQNALVFAPGKTIIESLRQLAETEYDRILPPRLYKPFAASVKITFTRDGERAIPVIPASYFNLIVTNTEKIRIQKEDIRKRDLGPLFAPAQADTARAEVANARLQAIASLPHLAIFSDEAHHTYGQSLDADLKKVRKTVDYLAAQTNVICVVNTTGTPYFRSQPLRDVVIWYGLSEGIRDDILKEVAGNIQAFDFGGDVAFYLQHVIADFFADYGAVALPDGTPAKLAIFFPQTEDVAEYRPLIEAQLARLGLSPTLLMEHHTAHENKDAFDRFKTLQSPHRVALLVSRGVEGWDVPALFACALARRLQGRNNFVLQAASRCLRQVPGNTVKARIYLSIDNEALLDKQLQETYGETIADLSRTNANTRTATIKLLKLDIPPLVVRQVVRTVVRTGAPPIQIHLSRPEGSGAETMAKVTYTIAEQQSAYRLLQQQGETVELTGRLRTVDLYTAAIDLAAVYRLDLWHIHSELKRIYAAAAELPAAHLTALAAQIEDQTRHYEVVEEVQEKALALIKLDENGFQLESQPDGTAVYTAEISYPVDREHLLSRWETWRARAGAYGFHYTPYNFDSNPEQNFFEQLLAALHQHPDQVEDVYFTGALTDPKKTDFFVEYKDADGAWRRYTPDFILRRKDGRCLIVEIKSAQFRDATLQDLHRADHGQAALTVEGRKAVAARRWETLNPDRLKYQIFFASQETIPYDQIQAARQFIFPVENIE